MTHQSTQKKKVMCSSLPQYLNKAALREVFDFIRHTKWKSVCGVYRVDSGVPGPTVGITLHTHGNEPSGLAVLSYFRKRFPLETHLQRGSVVFILNNIRATEKFLNARTIKEKRAARYIDLNMNRLPDILTAPKTDTRYEVTRARELLPIWRTFNFGFDIHSVQQPAAPMIMAIGSLRAQLIKGFPISTIISNIESVQHGKPAVAFYGNGKIPIMGIESGSHEDVKAFKRAVACTTALLHNVGVIAQTKKSKERMYREYVVTSSVTFPDASFKLIKTFSPYERITKGQLLASNGVQNLIAPFDGHVLFPPPGRKPSHSAEEVLFLALPVRRIHIV